MTQPTLVVMAAGMGARFGGLKQVEPVGPDGEIVIDYSIYDALRAGFGRVVFVIRREFEAPFRERVGRDVETRVEVAYVFQELADVPSGLAARVVRSKPWGTGHAVLSCRDQVRGPFAVINADDFYGREAFSLLAGHLTSSPGAGDREAGVVPEYSMVGYRLGQTLSEHGSVARGVCRVSPGGTLVDIAERLRVEHRAGGIACTDDGRVWSPLSADATVSMNAWGFTQRIFDELAAGFPAFLERNHGALEKAEYLLPDVVNGLLHERRARVRVLGTTERWFGITYRDDLPVVRRAIADLIRFGAYPRRLWDDVIAVERADR